MRQGIQTQRDSFAVRSAYLALVEVGELCLLEVRENVKLLLANLAEVSIVDVEDLRQADCQVKLVCEIQALISS